MSSTLPSNVSDFHQSTKAPRPPKERAPLGGIIVTVILAVALIAIIFVAVTRLSSGALTRPTSGAGSATQVAVSAQSTAVAGTPADAATAAAIQQVIQQVDQAQVQAVQTNNPQVMQPTATDEFYQDQVATNQDLVDNGVTDIKLVNIEWGPITVNGDKASATDYETWSTTFQDGTTEQSRDRNVYTLVQDNGTWKVSADDHPDQQNQNQSSPLPGGAP